MLLRVYTARFEQQLNKLGAIDCWQVCQARKNKAHSEMLHHESFENAPALTAREHEILEYIAQGLSTKEVAQHVGIAPRTVDKHVENIRLKLRAKNRTHMIACAVFEGLLEVEEDEREEPSGNRIPGLLTPPKE